jgi:tRNA pseudouridine55 synthase
MIEGLLRVDKPSGPTSHDIISAVRKRLNLRRVGHSGTLDPAASGLLLILVGRATRLARFLPSSPKRYTGTLQLGLQTSTDDLEGEVLACHEGPLPTPESVLEAAHHLLGDIEQVPPAVSAIKIGGQRLYRLARKGRPVEAPPRPVRVDRFELTATDNPAVFSFEADVGSGTYIRSLARDLGAALGCGGTLSTLRRTSIERLTLQDAWKPNDPDTEPILIPIEEIPLIIPEITIDHDSVEKFRNGVAVPFEASDPIAGEVAVHTAEGARLGIGEWEEGWIKPRVVLPPLPEPGLAC